VAQYLLDQAKVGGPPKLEDGSLTAVVEGVEELFSHEEQIPVKFNYRMTWTQVGPAETYTVKGKEEAVRFGPDLYHVKVLVWWMIDNPEDGRAEGGGRRAVEFERLISTEKKEEEPE
jgi:hypothetical protein